jgi:hyperosmotically inducible protein
MKQVFFGFLAGLMVGILGYWFLEQEQNRQKVREAKSSVMSKAEQVGSAIQERVSEIRTQDFKHELEHGGTVVRETARRAGSAISDATANTRLTTAIKAKLITEPGISAMSINVDATEGLVTLSGTVASHEQAAKAVKIASETDGVQKVVSTLQVKSK